METPYELPSVWISSIKHLERLEKIYKENSYLRGVIFARYGIPDGFPHVRQLFHNLIDGNSVYFNSKDVNIPFTRVYNLMVNIDNKIQLGKIKKVGRYKLKETLKGFFNINWIHIVADNPLFNGDFLISIGTHNALKKRRKKRNDELYSVLKKMIEDNSPIEKDY
jgi:hypothetical protein